MSNQLKKATLNAGLKLRKKVKDAFNSLIKEEKGGAEIVAIMLIVIILIGIAVIFRNELGDLIEDMFNRISNDVQRDL